MVWRHHTWQMCAPWSCLSSAGGSCGRQTAGHSSCRAQRPRLVGETLPWLARPLGTASPSTCGLHHCPEIHLRKNSKLIYLAASTPEVFPNWALYKLTYSFIHIQSAVASSHDRMWDLWNIWFQAVCTGQCAVVYLSTTDSTELSPSP